MRISVITICYNAESTIKKTMISVLKQNFTDMEYILVDGLSSDNTNKIIEELRPEFNDHNIPLLHISEGDKGISDAFNKGIENSHGEIICILNSGDRFCKDSLKKINQLFDNNIDVLYGNIIWDDTYNHLRYIRKSDKSPKMLALKMSCLHPATFIKKSAYDKVGNYRIDFKISMDRELLCRMKRAGLNFKYINEEFAIVESGGISDQKDNTQERLRESAIIAHDNCIPSIIFIIYTSYRRILLNIKTYLKRNTKLYHFLKRNV